MGGAVVGVGERGDAFGLWVNVNIVDSAGEDIEVGASCEKALNFSRVEIFVGLSTWTTNGGAFGEVEDAELDACVIDGETHETTHGIDFANHLTFGEATDCGVAGHDANGFGVDGDESDFSAAGRSALLSEEVCGSPCGFCAGVATSDDDDVV